MQSIRTKGCPACRGLQRRVVSSAQTQDPNCAVCEGRGYVTDVACEGCGRPAYKRDEEKGIVFCGREKCLDSIESLSKRREARKSWVVTPIHHVRPMFLQRTLPVLGELSEVPRLAVSSVSQPWLKHPDEPDEVYWSRAKDFM